MSLIKAGAILKVYIAIQVVLLFTYIEAGRSKSSRKRLLSDENLSMIGEPDGGPSCTNEYLVEYMVLSMSWPPGVCSSGRFDCKGSKKNFVIKGLKPSFKENRGKCCAKENFNPDELGSLETELKNNWPALDNKDEKEVWTKEWEQSGKCATKIKGLNSVFKYFSFALRNFNKLALKSSLTTRGFYPTDHQSYYGQNLLTAIHKRYGVRADIQCAPMKQNPKKLVLTEINFCYDTDLKKIDCPYTSSNCLGEVFIVKTYLKTI